jgi:hypothetical protein
MVADQDLAIRDGRDFGRLEPEVAGFDLAGWARSQDDVLVGAQDVSFVFA